MFEVSVSVIMIYNSLEPKQKLLIKIIFEIKNELRLEGLGLFQKEITYKEQIILKAAGSSVLR